MCNGVRNWWESNKRINPTKYNSRDTSDSQSAYVLHEGNVDMKGLELQQTFSMGGIDDINKTNGVPIEGSQDRDPASKLAGRIVNSRQFKRLVITLIVLNAMLMGMATSDIVTENSGLQAIFDVKDLIFLILFSIEVLLQFVYHRLQLFYDGWLLFDFLVISLSWVTSYLLMLRTFRLVRTLRLATRVPDLSSLAISLVDSIPKVIALGCLMILMFFVFAVVFTDMFKDLYVDGFTSEDYFSSLDKTFFTLFQIMTLDGWSKIAMEVMKEKPWAWLPFVAFVIVSSYFCLNLIIAVVCEAVFKAQTRPSFHNKNNVATLANDITRLEGKIEELTSLVEKMIAHQQLQPAEQRQEEEHVLDPQQEMM